MQTEINTDHLRLQMRNTMNHFQPTFLSMKIHNKSITRFLLIYFIHHILWKRNICISNNFFLLCQKNKYIVETNVVLFLFTRFVFAFVVGFIHLAITLNTFLDTFIIYSNYY